MKHQSSRSMRMILNGKAAANPTLREAVGHIRDRGDSLDVRVTWEVGDAARFASEAVECGIDIVIAAGGDGTLNEVVNGVIRVNESPNIAVGVVPFGTANDFATGCGIPIGDPLKALLLIAEGKATSIDVGKVNDRYFINVASGGFGAEITASTPVGMKKVLGGAAYALMGVVKAAKMSPYHGALITPDGEKQRGSAIIVAVGNGRQTGGGFQVAPLALLDDGLLDVMTIHDVEVQEFGTLLNELMNLGAKENTFVSYQQMSSFSVEVDSQLPLNLDGEPVRGTSFQFDVLERRLPFILPPEAPLSRKE
jgi:lipid kinase YegS